MATAFFSVGVTFDVVTPESAECGEFANTGWTAEPEPMTFREAWATLERYAPFDGESHRRGGATMYESDGEENYRTGEVTRHAVHIYGEDHRVVRLLELWDRRERRRQGR